ncbi:Resolvase HTH domain-containing protein [Entamoeba marina]
MEDIPLSPIKEAETISLTLPPATNTQIAFCDSTHISETVREKKERESLPKKTRSKSNVTEEILKIIHRMHQRGYKAKEIAVITDLTKSTVYKYIDRMDESPETEDMSSLIRKRGRKRTENTELQEKINSILDCEDSPTLKAMKDKLKEDGHDISISYLSKTMKKMGVKKKPAQTQRKMTEEKNQEMVTVDSLPPPIA